MAGAVQVSILNTQFERPLVLRKYEGFPKAVGSTVVLRDVPRWDSE